MTSKFLTHFRIVGEEDKNKAIEKLIKDSTPDFDFSLFIVLSMLMATFGLLIDSVAVVIGSMLVAPILYPILSLALGMSLSDHALISRSLYTVVKSVGLGIGTAVIATILLAPGAEGLTGEILARAEPSLIYFSIAVVSGLAVSFALVRPELSETLPGIAVSVALIPPLAVVGIGIAKLNLVLISGSFVLFLINIIGVAFASMVVFALTDLHRNKPVVKQAIKASEDRIEEEKWATRELRREDDKDIPAAEAGEGEGSEKREGAQAPNA